MADNKSIHKFKAGDVFHERYTLEKIIGVGGFADVWKAVDTKTNTIIALKIYTNLDEDGINDLSEEYTRMQGLNHTNILKAEHFDSWGNIPYLVMKYCDGGSLDKKIGKMSAEELMSAITQIANGLKYLHSQGIVHQDIKPANILIDNTSGTPCYVLSDFGISSMTKTKLSHSVNLKNQGVSMTEAYAPPEKFSSKKADRRPDRKGDIFSFGISIYEMATGSMPFDELSTGRQLMYEGAEIDFSEIQDEKIRRISELCMQADKEDRPTAEEVYKIAASSEIPDEPVRKQNPNKKTKRIKDTPNRSKLPLFILLIGAVGAIAYLIFSNWIPAATGGTGEKLAKGYVQQVDTFTINGIHLEMVKIPGGKFKLGCDDASDPYADANEKPAKPSLVGDFYMGKYEVTQKLWSVIMNNNPSTVINDNYPVNNVSWEDCQLFIEKLNRITGRNFRLPTEAEWEYAAKATLKSDGSISEKYTKFAGGDMPDSYAWYSENSGNTLHVVGGKKPNAFGLYDMCGNVIEWCQDIYTNYNTGDPEIDKEQRVLRGGYFGGDKSSIRTTSRGSSSYSMAMAPFGFRLCL
ncbi:bifunctional serine/threonine-protein kinase/formylglycine-generating enzyme family protein [Phocaeicola coprocola]|uniref:bifunctional serine/threonine-protein kinase/formylglycine-generating enzyme family protein n=1 Tax=Phocaeicola coprocola TaxID=310298 RepID=UPI0032C08709